MVCGSGEERSSGARCSVARKPGVYIHAAKSSTAADETATLEATLTCTPADFGAAVVGAGVDTTAGEAASPATDPELDGALVVGDGDGDGDDTVELLELELELSETEQDEYATSEMRSAVSPFTRQLGACDAAFFTILMQSVSEQTCSSVTSPATRLLRRSHSGALASTASSLAMTATSSDVQLLMAAALEAKHASAATAAKESLASMLLWSCGVPLSCLSVCVCVCVAGARERFVMARSKWSRKSRSPSHSRDAHVRKRLIAVVAELTSGEHQAPFGQKRPELVANRTLWKACVHFSFCIFSNACCFVVDDDGQRLQPMGERLEG